MVSELILSVGTFSILVSRTPGKAERLYLDLVLQTALGRNCLLAIGSTLYGNAAPHLASLVLTVNFQNVPHRESLRVFAEGIYSTKTDRE